MDCSWLQHRQMIDRASRQGCRNLAQRNYRLIMDGFGVCLRLGMPNLVQQRLISVSAHTVGVGSNDVASSIQTENSPLGNVISPLRLVVYRKLEVD